MMDATLRDLDRTAAATNDDADIARATRAHERAGHYRARLWYVGVAHRGRVTHEFAPDAPWGKWPMAMAVCGQSLDPQTIRPETMSAIICRVCCESRGVMWAGRWAAHQRLSWQRGDTLERWVPE